MNNYNNNFRGASRSNSSGARSFGPSRFSRPSGGYRRGVSNNRFRSRGPSLNPMMFVKRAENVVQEAYIPENKFADFSLVEQLRRNIEARNYINPTPIQDQAIKPLLEGRDLIGIAQTGTGKTAAFLIPLINKMALNSQEKALIVAPTRELAMQIRDELQLFLNNIRINSVLCIGGAPMYRQIETLRRNPNMVIGTPGRIMDLDRRGILRLSEFRNVVLDEVDRMLDMGFLNDVSDIVSKLPRARQSLFFSATMPDKTREITSRFLNNPVSVSVKTSSTAANVDQDIVRTAGKDKVELLHQLLIQEGFDKVLVFGRTKMGVNRLERVLADRGFRVASIHGNKSQGQRQRALRQLRTDEVQILLATDVASRGLDIQDVTHVINFDVPESYEDYVHRIGRTGRAGKTGVALTFVD